MRLHHLLDRVATAHEPPAPDGEGGALYTRAVRRRRLVRGAATVGVGVGLGVALVASVLTVVAPHRQDAAVTSGASPGGASSGAPSDGPRPGTTVEPTPAQAPGGLFPGYRVGGNGQHLYLFTEHGCTPCSNQLWGSDDGGRTWTFRQSDVVAGDPILVASSGAMASTGLEPWSRTELAVPRISTDGGRTSRAATTVPSVEGSTDEQAVECRYRGSPSSPDSAPAVRLCDVMAVDFRAGTYGPLRTQPGIEVNEVWAGTAGVLWAAGSVVRDDRRTMAVARSTDGGRSWRTHAFEDASTTLAEIYADMRLGVDGTAVVDVAYRTPTGLRRLLARFRDGGWQTLDGPPLNQPEATPLGGPAVSVSYVDADGRHVMTTYDDFDAPLWTGVTFWAVAPGERTYRTIERPAGLPPKSYPDTPDPSTFLPGHGYAMARQDGLWLSTDGKAWTKATIA